MLRILLLGTPKISWQDQPIEIDRRTPRALLYYLAARGGSVSRAELLLYFWGDQPEKKARNRLRENISRLRHQLPDPELLVTTRDIVGLDLARTWIDQLEFEALVARAGKTIWQIPAQELLPEQTYQLLLQAVELWREPHYLWGINLPESTDLDTWLRETTTHIESLCCSSMERLAQHEYVNHQYAKALALARKALENDRSHETLTELLIQILIQMGMYREARQHFKSAQEILQAASRSLPARMQDLYQQINSDLEPLNPEQLDWGLAARLDVPLVGRTEILLEIQSELTRHRAVFLIGESGLGKTRLIREAALLISPKPRILIARGRDPDIGLPYQPIIDTLRQYISVDEWINLSKIWGSQLVTLVPDVFEYRPELAAPTVSDVIYLEAMLLEAIRQVFLLLARQRPLLLVVDDLQWVDRATLSVLTYLLSREPFNQQAWILGAAREDELSAPLSKMLESAQVARLASIISLTPFNQQEIKELSAHVLGQPIPNELLKKLAAKTGGNPLFLLETLSAASQIKQQPELSLGVSIPVRTTFDGLIQSRINRLNLTTQQILLVAAVIGSEFSPDLLEQASQREYSLVSQALDELEKQNLIIPTSLLRDLRYRFQSEHIREVVLRRAAPAWKQVLHGQVARAWQSSHRNPPAAVLAFHHESAGEALLAYRCWLKAGRHARELFANQDASQAYARARALLPAIDEQLSDDDLYTLYAEWAEMTYETHDPVLVQELGQALLEQGEQRGSPLLIGTGLDIISDAQLLLQQIETGLAYVNRAIPYLEKADNLFELMEAHLHKGVFLYCLNRLEEATHALQLSLDCSKNQTSIPVLRARSFAHGQIALILTLQGWPLKSREYARLALQDAQNSRRFYQQVVAQMMLTFSGISYGQYEQALETALESIELARRMQALRLLGYSLGYAAMAEICLGRIEAAFQHAQQAIEMGEQLGQSDIVAMASRSLGEIFRMLQDYPQALIYFQRGSQASPAHFMGRENVYRAGLVNVYLGKIEAGFHQIHSSRDQYRGVTMKLGELNAQLCLVMANFETAAWQSQGELLALIQLETAQRSMQHQHTLARILAGELALRQGRIENALTELQWAASWAGAHKNPWLEISALARLEQAQKQADISDPCTAERIIALLDGLAANLEHDRLIRAFTAFRVQVLSRTRIATENI